MVRRFIDNPFARYLLAFLSVSFVFLVLFITPQYHHKTLLLPLILPVALCAWFLGLGPGLFALGVSSILESFFFLNPMKSLSIMTINDRLFLGAYLLEGLIFIWLVLRLRSASHLAAKRQNMLARALHDQHLQYNILLQGKRELENTYEELAKSRSRFARLFETELLGIFICYFEGEILDANDHFLKMVGYTREDLEAHKLNWRTMTPPGYDTDDMIARSIIKNSTTPKPYEKEYYRKDGSRIHVSIAVEYLEDQKTILVFCLNIQKQKEFQKSLEEKEVYLHSLVEALPNVVWTTDTEGIVTYVSDRGREFGFEASKSQHAIWHTNVHPEDMRLAIETWNQGRKDGTPIRAELRIRNTSGHYVWMLVQAVPIKDRDNKILHWVGTNTDVSRLKKASQQLLQAKEAADNANRSKSEFLANMSHEIRTPLTSIMGFADMLTTQDISNEERTEYAYIILKNGDILCHLIDDILDLAKVESGRLGIEEIPVRVKDIAMEVEDLFFLKAQEKNLQFTVTVCEYMPDIILTDPIRLKQILINIVGNAIKFTEEGSVGLHLRMRGQGEKKPFLEATVADTGIGISPKQAQSLFHPFSQADASMTRRFGGTGLGLSLSRRLAQMMGGDIYLVESTPKKGSTFMIYVETKIPGATDETHPVLM